MLRKKRKRSPGIVIQRDKPKAQIEAHRHIDYTETTAVKHYLTTSTPIPDASLSKPVPSTLDSTEIGPYITETSINGLDSVVTYSFASLDLENNPDLPQPKAQDGSDWNNVEIGSRNVWSLLPDTWNYFECSILICFLQELAAWRPYADLYIQTCLWQEGLGDMENESGCSCGRIFDTNEGENGLNRPHRCRQCYQFTELLCQDCMNDKHAFLPFHVVEVRNKTFLEVLSRI